MRTPWMAALLVAGMIGCGKKEPAHAQLPVVEEARGTERRAVDASAMSMPLGAGGRPTAEPPGGSAVAVDAATSLEGASADAVRDPITDARVDVDFGPCYGTCPVYALHLKSDGMLSGEGTPRKLSDEQTQRILRLFDDAFSKPVTACPMPTDVQRVKVSYQHGKTVRSTEYWSGQPCPSNVVDAVKRLNALRGH